MTNQINANVLKNFIVNTLGTEKLSKYEAKKYDIGANEFDEADVDENSYLDLDEMLDNDAIYEKFATMYVEERDNKEANKKDAEREKEEEMKVKDKNGAGI